jgi:DNA-directed RNA polymerase specialized sigma24 family protein
VAVLSALEVNDVLSVHGTSWVNDALSVRNVALSAFDSFCRGAEQGRFPQLTDRDDLWQLLVMITCRKAADLVERESRRKRGGKGKGHRSLVGSVDFAAVPAELEQVFGSEPTPEFAAEMVDECRYLLGLLGDGKLRSIALWKMEGYTNAEIAEKLGCVRVTIERRLRLIRGIWTKALAQRESKRLPKTKTT